MAKQFVTTLAVALLGFIATKAQAPFTGRVEYEFIFKTKELNMPTTMAIEYRPKYMKIIPLASIDSATGQYEMEMVVDYSGGQAYQLLHAAKKAIIKERSPQKIQPQMTLIPGSQTTIAGIKANRYDAKVDSIQLYDVWLSDSVTVATNEVLAKDNDFFIFVTGKILLKAAPKQQDVLKGKAQDMTIHAVKITPLTFSDSNYQLPPNYTVEDESAIKRMQDSLLQAFKTIDSQLQQGRQDSALVGRSPTKRVGPTSSPQKPQKKAPVKGNKPVARRPKQ